jgi:putative transposase
LSLRMDHGSQYTSDDLREQIRFWGIAPSYAFVAEPQTNGVAERFNRTMKEQAIHGRIFNNLEEVRAAAVAFKDRYNRDWRLEKLGFKSPLEARQERMMKLAA